MLAPVQVGLVMDLWGKLDQQAREQAVGRAASLVDGPTASEAVIAQNFYGEIAVSPGLFEGGSRHRRKRIAPDQRRPGAASDLLFLILDDPSRTRHALYLLIPITLAFMVIVGSFVVWAILQPDRASMIGAILGGGIVLPVTTSLRRLARR